METELFDLIIAGAGPAGLAAACAAKEAGISYLVVERSGIVQSLVEHPQQIRYFSPADEIAIANMPFPVAGGHKPTREDALAYFRGVASYKQLKLALWEELVSARRDDAGLFEVVTHKHVTDVTVIRKCRYMLVCTGTFPNPKKLHIPGAKLEKVISRLDDPTPYYRCDVLVVGGGNSAVTGAMTLAEAGANVTLAMRRAPADYQSHLRPFIVRDIKIMAEEKRLTLLTDIALREIQRDKVVLTYCQYGSELPDDRSNDIVLPNDFVFALIGHTADYGLFDKIGVPLAEDGLPIYDEQTAETPVPGIFVAGSLSRANIILESRRRAVEIVERIKQYKK